ncbi:hypothetical protein EMIHUDRAFT_253293 [Emiliania huxleyi CCMP1516]|uniref:Uncharacterized protein n=2 Tax=Emiliania huxleyi TaxID=2903 RepID=A0A0D3KA87_EMIH1|nr:hypothetical protein EMIHUDRAFT_253293 [Emiliania huxleyi CCMP1516]EOD32672.1 hypothetical protein EMIHUDRAFT_253293 [Emiliania huxleyi CCMP1516]|eukprot:XP_005785101.1 hypothetical protein EMIHUDRAFT_253293 [Emiliania huxleyi CCMP1516]
MRAAYHGHGTPWGSSAGSVPFAMQRGRASPDVLAHVQRAAALMEADVLALPVSADKRSGHVNREGHYHGLGIASRVCGAETTPKPAAPTGLRALLAFLRAQATPPLLARLGPLEASSPFASLLSSILRRGGLFAHLSVQVHSGGTWGPGWHVDHPVSSLHLGIALHGLRTLHANCSGGAFARCPIAATTQPAGSIYFSSPAAFQHGVVYPEHRGGSFAESIVAVQARLLSNSSGEAFRLDSAKMGRDARTTFAAVAEALLAIPLKLPSLEELRAAESLLAVDESSIVAGYRAPGEEASCQAASAHEVRRRLPRNNAQRGTAAGEEREVAGIGASSQHRWGRM